MKLHGSADDDFDHRLRKSWETMGVAHQAQPGIFVRFQCPDVHFLPHVWVFGYCSGVSAFYGNTGSKTSSQNRLPRCDNWPAECRKGEVAVFMLSMLCCKPDSDHVDGMFSQSSLFNRFAGRKVSLVYDQPGVTRDRIVGAHPK
jgi:hypothetical protein